MLRIRKEKLYGVALGIGKLRDDIRDFIERWKLQRDRIAPGAMLGDRVGGLCAVVQRNVRLLVRRAWLSVDPRRGLLLFAIVLLNASP
jgi:hypothetical protein